MVPYKIMSFDKSRGQILVQFEDFPLIAIDLHPDENGKYLTGEALASYIRGFLPTWEIERRKKIAEASNVQDIEALVVKSEEPKVDDDDDGMIVL